MGLELIQKDNVSYYVVEGPPINLKEYQKSFDAARYAVNMDVLRGLGDRKQFPVLAQLYGIVIPGLILSTHLFRGVNRNLYYDDSFEGDSDKLIFSRKPPYDYTWTGGRNGNYIKKLAPSDQVFLILISENKNKHKENFPDVDGWIDHWNWADEDPVLSEAPIDWVDRYDKKLWSREN